MQVNFACGLNLSLKRLLIKGALILLDIEKAIQETESFLAERNDIPLNVFRFLQKLLEDERKIIDMARNYKIQKPVFKSLI